MNSEIIKRFSSVFTF